MCLCTYTINKHNTKFKRINDYTFVKILCAKRENIKSVGFIICVQQHDFWDIVET